MKKSKEEVKNKKDFEIISFFVWEVILHEISHLWKRTFENSCTFEDVFKESKKIDEEKIRGKITKQHNHLFWKYLDELKSKYPLEDFHKKLNCIWGEKK